MNIDIPEIAEDGTLDVAISKKHEVRISNQEWFEISLALEPFHAVFYKLWQMGKPIFNEEIETAAVQFDEVGNFIWFHFNPSFWKRLKFSDKLFTICHEALHIVLNHGIRTRDSRKTNGQAANVALDVVVNHTLVKNFGFNREDIEDWSEFCWVDTVFKNKNPTPPDNEMFEYYYNLFEKTYGKNGMGESGPGLVDDHDSMKEGSENWNKVIDNLNSGMTEEEKESLKSTVEKHFQGEPEQKNKTEDKKAGSGTGGQWTFAGTSHVQKKAKWETIIKKWSKKYINDKEKDQEQWTRLNRRMVLLPVDMFLPSDMEVFDYENEKTKIDVWFFLDTSGSCWDLKDRFFNAASSLPEKRFDIKLLCFDTAVKETTLESKKIYGGGGTSFHILEAEVQKQIKEEKIKKYPDAIFVITDGYGNTIKPEKPDRWHFFLTEGGIKNYIDPNCNFYFLKDFE